jgi:hypothetical protein
MFWRSKLPEHKPSAKLGTFFQSTIPTLMPNATSHSPQLENLILIPDVDGTIACIEAMSAAKRQAQRTHLLRMDAVIQKSSWDKDQGKNQFRVAATREHVRAVSVAIFLCGTAKDAAAAWIDEDELIALGIRFQPPALDGIADEKLKIHPNRIRAVQRLISAGLVSRPDSEAYALGLIALPSVIPPRSTLVEVMHADPGLTASFIRVFDVEGTAECSLASADKYNHDPALSWTQIFLNLVEQGVYTRQTLLDKTLGALERDWPQYRSGWFSRFHEALAPTTIEMIPFVERYKGLCLSRIPPTVTLALDVMKGLAAAGKIEDEALITTMAPLMSSGVKAQVEGALKIIETVVKRTPAQQAPAALIIIAGLAHPAENLQKKILGLLAKWCIGEDDKVALRDYLPGVAAVNREAMSKLIGGNLGARPVPEAAVRILVRESPSVLDISRELQVINDLNELVERIAYVFENDTDVDEFERVAEALVRMAPQLSKGDARLGPILKRARRVTKPLSLELSRLVVFIVTGERLNSATVVDHAGNGSSAYRLLSQRISELMDFSQQHHALAPLSSPTHVRGFIDPERFIERLQAHQVVGAKSGQLEEVSALLRLAPETSESVRKQARLLADTAFTRAVRYALGDNLKLGPERALFSAAARIRHPDADDPLVLDKYGDLGPDAARAARYSWRVNSWTSSHGGNIYHHHDLVVSSAVVPDGIEDEMLAVLRHPPQGSQIRRYYQWGFAGIDEGMVNYAASLMPSSLEAFFAEGARMLGNNLDWSEAQWQNKAYLNPLLDSNIALNPMANLVLALGLAGKDPGQTAIAIDALVQAGIDGRVDTSALGATLRDLLSTPLVKASRYRKSLDTAARANPNMCHLIFKLLCVMVTTNPESPPKDMPMLLEMLRELKLRTNAGLPLETHAAIAALKVGGKGKALQKSLLGDHPVTGSRK